MEVRPGSGNARSRRAQRARREGMGKGLHRGWEEGMHGVTKQVSELRVTAIEFCTAVKRSYKNGKRRLWHCNIRMELEMLVCTHGFQYTDYRYRYKGEGERDTYTEMGGRVVQLFPALSTKRAWEQGYTPVAMSTLSI